MCSIIKANRSKKLSKKKRIRIHLMVMKTTKRTARVVHKSKMTQKRIRKVRVQRETMRMRKRVKKKRTKKMKRRKKTHRGKE